MINKPVIQAFIALSKYICVYVFVCVTHLHIDICTKYIHVHVC